MRFVRAGVPLALVLLATDPVSAQSQLPAREYPVKFVCGRRVQPPPTAGARFDAVAPGLYFTAVNIHNPSRDAIRIRTRIATTQAAPVGGVVVSGPALSLEPGQALELDCAEILRVAGPQHLRGFLKGFVLLVSDHDLDVVAVYTASIATGVMTLDVESVATRPPSFGQGTQRCPDLVIGRIERPTYASGHTFVRLAVGNMGDVAATNVGVNLEDPGGTGPERIVETKVPLIAPGAWVVVTLEFVYTIEGNARVAAIVALVDPKNVIAECDETNNRRTLGSP
jgi:hypothetical protein